MTENQIVYLQYFVRFFGNTPVEKTDKNNEQNQKGCWY